jgi:hypothetical protein
MDSTTRTYCKMTTTKDSTTGRPQWGTQSRHDNAFDEGINTKGADIADTGKAGQTFRLAHFGTAPCPNMRMSPLAVNCHRGSPQLPTAIAKTR